MPVSQRSACANEAAAPVGAAAVLSAVARAVRGAVRCTKVYKVLRKGVVVIAEEDALSLLLAMIKLSRPGRSVMTRHWIPHDLARLLVPVVKRQ